MSKDESIRELPFAAAVGRGRESVEASSSFAGEVLFGSHQVDHLAEGFEVFGFLRLQWVAFEKGDDGVVKIGDSPHFEVADAIFAVADRLRSRRWRWRSSSTDPSRCEMLNERATFQPVP